MDARDYVEEKGGVIPYNFDESFKIRMANAVITFEYV